MDEKVEVKSCIARVWGHGRCDLIADPRGVADDVVEYALELSARVTPSIDRERVFTLLTAKGVPSGVAREIATSAAVLCDDVYMTSRP